MPIAAPPKRKTKPAAQRAKPIVHAPTRRSARASAAKDYNENKPLSAYRQDGANDPSSTSASRYLRNSGSFSPEADSAPAWKKIRQLSPPPPPVDFVDEASYGHPLPTMEDGYYHFEDGYEGFTPNLSPREILESGSFGGTYWRSVQLSLDSPPLADC